MNKQMRFCQDENDAEVMELAVYAGLFIPVAIVGLTPLGTTMSGFFTSFVTLVPGNNP